MEPSGQAPPLQTLGVFAAPHKPQAWQLADRLRELCTADGICLLLQPETAQAINRPELAAGDDEIASRSDVVVTLSGDGGVLAAARATAVHDTPILAVNLGRLGFLSALSPDALDEAFAALHEGRYDIQERLMLQARVLRRLDDGTLTEIGGSIGLNDAVVAKSALARILRLSVSVDNDLVATTLADGLIISTPTGSTGYALSAGGPIVPPDVPVLLLCPICPHSLAQRPLIMDANERVEVRVEWLGEEAAAEQLEAMLTIDGQIGIPLFNDDIVRVQRSAHVTRLIRFPGENFYDRLRDKLGWGP